MFLMSHTFLAGFRGLPAVTVEALTNPDLPPTREDWVYSLPTSSLPSTTCMKLSRNKVYSWAAEVLTPWHIQLQLGEVGMSSCLLFAPSGYLLSSGHTEQDEGEKERSKIAKFFVQAGGMPLKRRETTVPAQSTVGNISNSLKAAPEHGPEQQMRKKTEKEMRKKTEKERGGGLCNDLEFSFG